MYYLIEEDPNKKEFIVFKSYELIEVMDRRMEMECKEHNRFCNYFILEYVSVEKRALAIENRQLKELNEVYKK